MFDSPPPPRPYRPPPPPPPPQQWDPNSVTQVTGGGPEPTMAVPPPPHVPSGKGDGSPTSVDTISMKRFADNLAQLVDPLNTSLNLVTNMNRVNAGGFFQGANMRAQVTGTNKDGMLQAGFVAVLKKVIKSVNDTHEAVVKLAKDYESTEDLNNMKVTQLNRTMADVSTDINAVGTAGSTLTSGSGSGSGSRS
jgi:flagellar hook-basal body complex protein FliE